VKSPITLMAASPSRWYSLKYPLTKPQKPRLHVGWKGGDLCGDGFVENFTRIVVASAEASWFETREDALLTMRV
jgi:hypothetical protein